MIACKTAGCSGAAETRSGYCKTHKHPRPKGVPISDRMDALTDRTGNCWTWTGGKCVGGYGQIYWRGKTRKAHRIAYELAYGAFPEELMVCHSCDNPSCVRPEHLFLGTAKDNVSDCCAKGRRTVAVGEAHPAARLRNNDVIDIRTLYLLGLSTRDIGRRYGVSIDTVQHILASKTWLHVVRPLADGLNPREVAA